ncbi:MAG: flagellar motor switch protein FliG [Planctomycetes bacterium]|nr:flagellar motor switch protein FliG [Planctomycetota bacterium]
MEEKKKRISGMRKTALLLVSLDKESAARLLKEMDQSITKKILKEVVGLDMNPPTKEERDEVLREYYKTLQVRHTLGQGGLDYAKELLFETLPKDQAQSAFEGLQKFLKGSPLSFLNDVDYDELAMFIQNEHPQTIALIVSQLDPRRASRLLESLPIRKQVDVVKRLSKLGNTSQDVLENIGSSLKKRFTTSSEIERQIGGVGPVAEIMKLVPRATEKAVLDNLEEEEPDIAQQIRNLMFTFEDISKVNDRGMQVLLQSVDKQQLATALKSCSEDLKEKIFKNMSKRAQDDLKETLDLMGPVRLSDVESAQKQIISITKKLEEEGQLIIEGSGGEEVVV